MQIYPKTSWLCCRYWPVHLGSEPWHTPFVTATPLWGACAAGHTKAVETLLRGGAAPDGGYVVGPGGSVGWSSPLHAAAAGGHVQTLAALLTAGADASALGECTGPFGLVRCDHPLYAAVAGGHREAIKLLVRHGADPMNDRGVYLLFPGPTAIEAALVRRVQELCTWHGGGGGHLLHALRARARLRVCFHFAAAGRGHHHQEHGEEDLAELMASATTEPRFYAQGGLLASEALGAAELRPDQRRLVSSALDDRHSDAIREEDGDARVEL